MMLIVMAATFAIAAAAPKRVNEAVKTPVMLCGVHTRVNPQTLKAMKAKHGNPCSLALFARKKHAVHKKRPVVSAPAAKLALKRFEVSRGVRIHGPLPRLPLALQGPRVTLVQTVVPAADGDTTQLQTFAGASKMVSFDDSIEIAGANLFVAGHPWPTVAITYKFCGTSVSVPIGLDVNVSSPGALWGTVGTTLGPNYNLNGSPYMPTNAGSMAAQLTVTTVNGTTSVPVTFVPSGSDEEDFLNVDWTPRASYSPMDAQPYFMGATPVASLANNGTRYSSFPAYLGGMGSKGDDTLGSGVRILNGWHLLGPWISTSISSPYVTPQSGNSSSGARIEGVTSGTIATDVHWWYDANNSVAYAVEWELVGPWGYRALSTEPKQGSPCEN